MNRRPLLLTVALLLGVSSSRMVAQAHTLSAEDKAIVQSARDRYYNLPLRGFDRLDCKVAFDYATVPLLSAQPDDAVRRLLEDTVFTLTLDIRGLPTVLHRYPAGASPMTVEAAAQVTGLLHAFVSGVFQTWTSKGLVGPVPALDSDIESVQKTASGYVFTLRGVGTPALLTLDKQFVAQEIKQGGLDEFPVYSASASGLGFSANHAVDNTRPDGTTDVRYEIRSQVLNGLLVPQDVHLRVNDNVNVSYALTGCKVSKGMVLQVGPPKQ